MIQIINTAKYLRFFEEKKSVEENYYDLVDTKRSVMARLKRLCFRNNVKISMDFPSIESQDIRYLQIRDYELLHNVPIPERELLIHSHKHLFNNTLWQWDEREFEKVIYEPTDNYE